MSSAGDITNLLREADQGDRHAADKLFKLVERDLRAIAGRRKQHYDNALDASTTALVDDVFCKLVGGGVTAWQPGDRRKFFRYAANKIHDLLVDTARAQATRKRGADLQRINIAEQELEAPQGSTFDETDFLLDLQEALVRMEKFAGNECLVFRIRYFLGCTFEETAEILDLSTTEAKRQFRKVQMWLQRELRDYHNEL